MSLAGLPLGRADDGAPVGAAEAPGEGATGAGAQQTLGEVWPLLEALDLTETRLDDAGVAQVRARSPALLGAAWTAA